MEVPEYTSSVDYAVLTNRFKLLNLVQRVAHRDVLEMIETIGLDALTAKGTLERWQPGQPGLSGLSHTTEKGRASPRRRVSPTARRTSPSRIGTSRQDTLTERFTTFARGPTRDDAKAAAARTALQNGLDESGESAGQHAAARRRPKAIRRTPSEEEAFYDRLAAPRERPEDVFIDHVEVIEASGPSSAAAASRRAPRSMRAQRPRYAPPGGVVRGCDGRPEYVGPNMPHARGPMYTYEEGDAYLPPRGPAAYYQTPPPLPQSPYGPQDPYALYPYGERKGASGLPDAPSRRVRFQDQMDEDTDALPPAGRTVGTSPLSFEEPHVEEYHAVPLSPPVGTESDGSAPAEVHGTAPRSYPRDGNTASATGCVPALQLDQLERHSDDAANEDVVAVSGGEEESLNAAGMSGTGGAFTPRGGARRQRAGGLRPKAKPQAALDSPRVPMEAIQHAASALLAQSNAARSQAAHHSINRDTARDGYHTTPLPDRHKAAALAAQSALSAPTLSSPIAASGGHLPPVASPVPVDPATKSTMSGAPHLPRPAPAAFAEVASTIDVMLLDHQRILNQLVRPDRSSGESSTDQSDLFVGDAATMDVSFSRPRQQQVGRYTTLSREQQRQIMQEHLLGDGSLDEDRQHDRAFPRPEVINTSPGVHLSVDDESDDVADEMLLYSRLQRKVDVMDADMARIERAHAAEQQQLQQQQQRQSTVAQPHSQSPDAAINGTAHHASSTSATGPLSQRRRRTERGAMPEAAIRRLQTFRKENYEYIAYNEKLWNTSQVSQFAFAQRLTNVLAEDCFNEVLEEVGTIMDDYVEGLADHELR